MRAEKNIDLFLNHHAYQVGSRRRRAWRPCTRSTRGPASGSGSSGKLFADCTGHAVVGHLAGAHYDMKPDGRMGMSNMWRWDEADQPTPFPDTPWALDLDMDDFPYPRDHHGPWFWESGFDKDPIREAEAIRDWNLRAVYGAFNAMKNRGGKDKHENAVLTWIAYIGGPRESRRLLGDVILSEEDIVTKKRLPRRLRAQHLVDRPALSQEAIRQEVPGQPVHLGRRVRRPRRPQLRLPGALPLLLLAERPQPVHGRPLHQRDARGAGHGPRDEDLRDDGRGGRQGGRRSACSTTARRAMCTKSTWTN